MLSNYEKLSEIWREKFMQLDQSTFARKLLGVRLEKEQVLFSYFGKNYRINRFNGEISGESKSVPDAKLKLLFYNLFWYSKEGAKLSGHWVPFRQVKNASPFGPAFETHVLKPFARTFNGQLANLEEAAEKLGGTKLRQGDAGYQISSFDCIPIQFLFWDGDDEFEAQANILFDYSVTDFIHVESTVSLASDGVARLAEEAGLQVIGNF